MPPDQVWLIPFDLDGEARALSVTLRRAEAPAIDTEDLTPFNVMLEN